MINFKFYSILGNIINANIILNLNYYILKTKPRKRLLARSIVKYIFELIYMMNYYYDKYRCFCNEL